MLRFTKIVATLGPVSSSVEALSQLVEAGINVVRINYSHGTFKDQLVRVNNLREVTKGSNKTIGVMVDLQGPKIRIGKFVNKSVVLSKGQKFIIDPNCELGNQNQVGLDYPDLIYDVKADDVLLLDDGRIIMDVEKVEDGKIFCIVVHGGVLSNNKGINKKGGGLSAPALTEKDRKDILTIPKLQADFVAISFPKSGADIREAKDLLDKAGINPQIIAKIERVEAVENIDEILFESDGIMVARGDLAVEVGDAAVPAIQKRIIRRARELNRFVITATQMMESMISSPVPTRAETSDVANAVLDGTDAVMLSAETAIGKYPIETVKAMSLICSAAEESIEDNTDTHFLNRIFTGIEEAIGMAALFAAHHLKIKAIAALTDSGNTAMLMSRLNIKIPIFALTPRPKSRYRCSILRGVFPILFKHGIIKNLDELLKIAEKYLLTSTEYVKVDDLIALTVGEPIGKTGSTNSLKLIKIEN